MDNIGIAVVGAIDETVRGVINKSAISKSNIRKRIATKKNRNENGRRGEFIGSKPHS